MLETIEVLEANWLKGAEVLAAMMLESVEVAGVDVKDVIDVSEPCSQGRSGKCSRSSVRLWSMM